MIGAIERRRRRNIILSDLEADIAGVIGLRGKNTSGITENYFARNQRRGAAVGGYADVLKDAGKNEKVVYARKTEA